MKKNKFNVIVRTMPAIFVIICIYLCYSNHYHVGAIVEECFRGPYCKEIVDQGDGYYKIVLVSNYTTEKELLNETLEFFRKMKKRKIKKPKGYWIWFMKENDYGRLEMRYSAVIEVNELQSRDLDNITYSYFKEIIGWN